MIKGINETLPHVLWNIHQQLISWLFVHVHLSSFHHGSWLINFWTGFIRELPPFPVTNYTKQKTCSPKSVQTPSAVNKSVTTCYFFVICFGWAAFNRHHVLITHPVDLKVLSQWLHCRHVWVTQIHFVHVPPYVKAVWSAAEYEGQRMTKYE